MPPEAEQPDAPQSDVSLESDPLATRFPTGGAPSLPPPLPIDRTATFAGGVPQVGEAMHKGQRFEDFQIEAVLGRGAFGVVYLARQLSLDRQVALKVAANQGSEGRTMARLEHQHIVQVFSETVDPTGKLRLLCMQLVPGATLDAVVHDLTAIRHSRAQSPSGDSWNGADVLASVDTRSKISDIFDPSALRDREALAEMDDLEAACWIGARLAEAVDYAHRQGVLHRDIKPANVLVNRYGRPLLADFNISFQSFDNQTSAEEQFGGTMAYMAPEHLDAFNPNTPSAAEAVDERSDLYSLGIVLHELLHGKSPLGLPPKCDDRLKYLERLLAVRSVTAPDVAPGPGSAAKAFSYIIAKCLAPDPSERFASGAELARALEGCRQFRGHERARQNKGFLARAVQLNPIRWVCIFALAPQFVGSIFNISYNLSQIRPELSVPQFELFGKLVLGYNLIVYPIALVLGTVVLLPLLRVVRQIHGVRPVAPEKVAWARRRSLQLPMWLLAIAAVGWLPGGVLFPLVIDAMEGPLKPGVFWHFVASFTLSGLIAVAYSLCGVQYAATRGLYARLWPRAGAFRENASRELGATRWRLVLMQALAGTIPSIAAIMLIATAAESSDLAFRLLTVALILLGTAGFFIMLPIAGRLARFIDSVATSDEKH